MAKIAAVIPAYNAERFVGQVVRRSRKFVGRVLVIDDGSKDDTAKVAKSAGAIVVRLKKNSGKANAIRAGVSALAGKAGILVLLDADLQHLPEEIPKVTRPVKEGKCDICIGSRFLGDYGKMPFHRRLTNRLTTLFTNLLTGYGLTDVQCGFRAIGPTAIAKLKLDGDRYTIETNMVLEAHDAGLRVREVPITTVYGKEVSYIKSGRHTLSLARIFAKKLVRKSRR